MAEEPLCGFTIDPPGAIDLDDAVYPLEDGRVRVFIANLADHLPPDSEIEPEARRRMFTRYHAFGRDSMLPMRLERMASLLPGRPRLSAAVTMRLDADLEVSELELDIVPFKSLGQYTYAEAGDMVRLQSSKEMVALSELAMGLLSKRRAAGALALYDLTRGFAIDEDGRIRRMPVGRPATAYILVQEMMILANSALSKYAFTNGVPVIFRAQKASPLVDDSMRGAILDEIVASYASGDGRRLANTSQRLDHLIGRAFYTPAPLGHWVLNVPFYGPWTSPIRRYPDLINWRQLLAFKRQQPFPYSTEQIAEIAKEATAIQQARREEVSEAYKEERRTMDEQLVSNGRMRDLIVLGEHDFERAIRLAPTAGPPPDAEAAIMRRAQQGTLPIKTAIQLLFNSERQGNAWGHSRAAAIEMLEKYPPRAVSVLVTAPTFVNVGLPKYDTSAAGASHERVFTCVARTKRGTDVVSVTAQSNTAKSAQQQAAILLIKRLVGTPVPDVAFIGKVAEAKPKPEVKPRFDFEAVRSLADAGNFVSALAEVCAKAGVQLAEFSFKLDGPPHAPTVTCTATLTVEGQDFSEFGIGRSNKQAKQVAAEKLFERVRFHVVRKAAA